jgi:NAD(P)H-hydrate epimerase
MYQNIIKIKKQSAISKKFEEKIISSEQMYKIENIGHNKFGMKKMLMMENAGFGVAEFILKKFKNKKLENFKILAVCGTGNNGGDAMVAARHLASLNLNIRVILLGDPTSIKTDEASTNFQVINKMNRTIDLVKLKNIDTKIKKDILDADIVIDGIFGTGIKGDILNPHLSIIKLINKSKAYIISVDIPSGLNPDNGETVSQCIKADTTITFHRIKSGLINNDQYTGNLILKKIGIPIETEEGLI